MNFSSLQQIQDTAANLAIISLVANIVAFLFVFFFMISVKNSLKDIAEGSIETAKQNKRIANSLERLADGKIPNDSKLGSDRSAER